jgi:ABC-type transporter Mla subunit MlaD
VRFSLSDEEFALVASAAAGERLALGAYAAQAVLAAARGSVQPQYALLREALATVMHAAGQARRIGVNLNQAVAALNSGEPPPQLRWYAEAAARTVRNLDDLADELRQRLP